MKWMLIPVLAAAAFAQQNKVSVEVAPDRAVTITIPLDPAFRPFVIYGRIYNGNPRLNQVFQGANLHGAEYRRVVELPPGHYWMMVALRNLDGQGKIERATFDVP